MGQMAKSEVHLRNWEEFNWTREKGVTEESSEVNTPELCISKTVFILPLNMNAILFIEFLSRVRFPHNILQVC